MNKFNQVVIFIILALNLCFKNNSSAQESIYKSNYIGILPSVLIEPYDSINAIEINIVPFIYEYKLSHELGVQFRPIVNYRFHDKIPGISQTGGTVALNRYFYSLLRKDFWLTPQLAVFYTYTYNQLDKIQTMTFGLEPGVSMKISNSFTLSLSVQPGINYYPNAYSKEFVESESGFKSHFGVIFHFGYSF